ncbi:MAG: class I SAM-dependent methyltransferase [Dehalococcoidales bacterium]|nr:class I SAM-dependent methyltransferase [Dehalococcoidales bacterium]
MNKENDSSKTVIEFYSERYTRERDWEAFDYTYGLRNPVGYYLNHRLRYTLIQAINKQKLILGDKSILDIGCGYGTLLRFLAEIRGTSQKLIGIDITPERISKAKSINSNISLLVGDAVSLPFEDESFDMVTQFDTFEHFLDEETRQKAASEISRILKPEGFFIWYDLLPFRSSSTAVNRGYSLKEVQTLFSKFELIYTKPFLVKFSLGFWTLLPGYFLPRFSFLLADFIERLPFTNHNNLIVLMKKFKIDN